MQNLKLIEFIRKIEYKWIIAALCFVMIFTVWGFCYSSKSMYTAAITSALNMPRGVFNLNETFRCSTTAILNLFFGRIVARFGERKMIAYGFIALLLYCIFFCFGSTVVHFCVGSVFLGIGIAWTTTAVIGSAINAWFNEKNGMVTGVIFASTGLGAALAVQILSPIIYSQKNLFSYRYSHVLVAMIILIVGSIVVVFFRNPPKKAVVNGDNSGISDKPVKDNSALKFVCRKPYFYLALLCIFICGMILQFIVGISAPFLYDAGFSENQVALFISMQSVTMMAGRLLSGIFYDRFGYKTVCNMCYGISIFSMLLLFFVTHKSYGTLIATVYALFSGFALPLDTILVYEAITLFGKNSYNEIIGIFTATISFGLALGAPILNSLYDFFGNYNISILLCVSLMVGALVMMQFVMHSASMNKTASDSEEVIV